MNENKESKPQSLLVTGVTGFIGSEILARLIKSKIRVVALARKKPDARNSLLAMRFKEHGLDPDYEINRIEWKETPFEDEKRFRNTLSSLDSNKYDWRVLHLAAIIKAVSNNNAQDRLNIGVTEDLLNWANRVRAPFYYMSSVVAFGVNQNSTDRDESTFESWEPFNEKIAYYRTKRLSHIHVKEHAQCGGAIFCPSVVHGALEQFKDSRGHLRALKSGKLSLAPRGGANFVSLDHVASVIVDSLLETKVTAVEGGIQERLLVGVNLKIVDYFNLYIEIYKEHLKAQGLRLSGDAAATNESKLKKLPKMIRVLPKSLSSLLVGIAKMTVNFGINDHLLLTFIQSTNYLFFRSKYPPDKSKDLEELKQAILSSMLSAAAAQK